jgi:predicted nucleic acid-binding protein
MGWVIDTCVWVDVERKRLVPNDIERITRGDPVYLSPVTIAELSAGVENTDDENFKAKRHAALARLMRKPCLHVDEDTGLIFGSIAGRLKKEGRAREHRIQDLWIAASAIQHGYKLLTRNEKDFKDIPGLDLVVYTD